MRRRQRRRVLLCQGPSGERGGLGGRADRQAWYGLAWHAADSRAACTQQLANLTGS